MAAFSRGDLALMERHSPEGKDEERAETHGINAGARPRKCLMCSQSFDSEWSGERVCKRCKSTDSWRTSRG